MKDKHYRVNITTKDNPYNPFEDFYHWFLFDIEKRVNNVG